MSRAALPSGLSEASGALPHLLPAATPEDVGLCGERLARIDEHLLSRYVDTKKISGALTVVARRGQVAHFSPLGLCDLSRGRPVLPDTIFRIYSMSKPVTSVALMMLYERGLFRLDAPVRRFIPEWRDLRVYSAGARPPFATVRAERDMTVRDLLIHTSGLTYGFMQRTNVDRAYRHARIGERQERTLAETIDVLAGIPLEFSPGSAWNYSVSTDICGLLVERLSGRPFDRFLREELFGPLGMVDTDFHVPPEKLDRFASNYTRAPDKSLMLEDDAFDGEYTEPPRFVSGGGGLVSTAADYLRFAQMLLNGGELDGARILGPRTIDFMTRNHLPGGADLAGSSAALFVDTPYQGTGFGLGFSVNLDPVQSGVIGSPGEFAWGGAASTVFWIDPTEELIVLFFTQLMPSTTFDFRGQLKAIVYPSIVD
jgi:CubicO group peptidase (beta-lactamase class C family)